MKILSPRTLFFSLFALVAAGSASAAAPTANPWSDRAGISAQAPALQLAHDDRYRHDERWHDRRDD
jgi:hypothetical protein